MQGNIYKVTGYVELREGMGDSIPLESFVEAVDFFTALEDFVVHHEGIQRDGYGERFQEVKVVSVELVLDEEVVITSLKYSTPPAEPELIDRPGN